MLALEGTRGLMFWTGCGCIPPVQLGAVAFELCLFAPTLPPWFGDGFPRLD